MKNSEKFKTTQERSNAFRGFCLSRRCQNCELDSTQNDIECAYAWLDLEAEEEKPGRCPCCEHETWVMSSPPFWQVECPACGYRASRNRISHVAVAAHNELCRKVKTQEGAES